MHGEIVALCGFLFFRFRMSHRGKKKKKRGRVCHTSYGMVAVIGRAQESTVIFLVFHWDGDLMPDRSCMMYVHV